MPHFRHRLARVGLDVFCFFAFLGVAGAYLGLGLLLIATLMDAGRVWRTFRQDPLAKLLLLFTLPLGISLSLGVSRGEMEAALHWAAVGSFFKLWLFLLVAYGLAGEPSRVWRALGLALLGFLLGRVLELDAESWQTLWALQRPGLGFTAIALAQYTAAALLALLLAAPRIWRYGGERGRVWQIPLSLGTGVLILVLLQVLLLSLSRGVWLSLALCLLWLGWLHYRAWGATRYLRGLAIAAAVLVCVILLLGWDLMVLRFSAENHVFVKLLDDRWDEIGFESVGTRLHMWRFALEHWLERPWFGWGPGALPALLQNGDVAPLRIYDDLHNVVLDLLVRLGLTGTMILSLAYALIMVSLTRARRQGNRLPEDLYLLIYGCLLLHLLCGMSNFRMLNSDWKLYWYLFAGAAYSFTLFPRGEAASTSR